MISYTILASNPTCIACGSSYREMLPDSSINDGKKLHSLRIRSRTTPELLPVNYA